MLPQTPWFVVGDPPRRATARLFCFHYAGGGASMYRDWARYLDPTIEMVAIQLPGRERRFLERPIDRCEAVVDALYEVLRCCQDLPMFFFGYSLGATLAYELACRLRDGGVHSLQHLIVAARKAPHLSRHSGLRLEGLCDTDFMHQLRGYGGTPPEVLGNHELMTLVLPRLRADFAMAETYEPQPRRALSCPVSAMGASDDANISESDILAWRAVTTHEFRHQMLCGGHFFFHKQPQAVAAAVNAIVTRPCDRGSRATLGTATALAAGRKQLLL